MQLRMWTYDLAREQSPSREILDRLAILTRDAGYNALGLYLEHRFLFRRLPWIAGRGAVTPEDIEWLQHRHPELQFIPFVNLLGHCEGMLYTEFGAQYACERFDGMQADPTNPEFVELCRLIIRDTLDAFDSEIIHLGGDETWQLGKGQNSERWVEGFAAQNPTRDAKAALYGQHFGPLARMVLDAGRTPAVWGDMFYEHPEALDEMPPETIIFDWQYFRTAEHTADRFRNRGFRTVLCPAIQTYSATWCHLPQSERNVEECAEAATRRDDFGVCVTTWECGLFGNYETILPAIQASGEILLSPSGYVPSPAPAEIPSGLGGEEAIESYRAYTDAPRFKRSYLQIGENAEEWASIVGCRLQSAGGHFAYSGHRSQIKSRLLLYSNPFLLWLRDRDWILGQPGERAYDLLSSSIPFAPDASFRGVSEFGKLAIEFVRFTEEARQAYANHQIGVALAHLTVCRQCFEQLERIASAKALRFGGSLADIERCSTAKEHVEKVMRRVKFYGDGSLGYLPSFETITHPKFVPHDQGNWWLMNRWANE
jgi:hypothetical protein